MHCANFVRGGSLNWRILSIDSLRKGGSLMNWGEEGFRQSTGNWIWQNMTIWASSFLLSQNCIRYKLENTLELMDSQEFSKYLTEQQNKERAKSAKNWPKRKSLFWMELIFHTKLFATTSLYEKKTNSRNHHLNR